MLIDPNEIQTTDRGSDKFAALSINPYGGSVIIGGSDGDSVHHESANFVFENTQNNGHVRFSNQVAANYIQSGYSGAVNSAKDLRFGPVLTAGKTWMAITKDGNIGIGTTKPANKLAITNPGDIGMLSNPTQGGIVIQDQEAYNRGAKLYIDANEIQTVHDGQIFPLIINPYGGNVRLGGHDGNFGSGATASFDFIVPTVQKGYMRFTPDTNANYIQSGYSGTTNSAKDLRFGPVNTSNSHMVLTASGSLGVGTMNPKTKLDVAGKVRIADGSQGSGKLLVSDNDGIARWAAASTLGIGSGSNPNDCSATNKVVNGHSYPVAALTNGNNYMSVFVESIANGRRQWSQEFLCTKGNLGALGGERSQLFCNNGYISNGTACIQPSADAATNCSATNMTINGKTYAVPSIKHNFSAVVYTHKAIANGTENYKQTFVCNNGTVQVSGSEEKISQTCNAGHSWNGSQCVAGGDPKINDIFKDTSCNTANIQVVTLTPGVDKIPENLNADTMYKLSSGTYEITKKINMNTCSAIVGEGNTKTTIQYAGLSFGTEDLISIEKSNAVVSDVKITGTKAGAGTVANLIKASGNISKVIIQKSNLENATQSGIDFDYVSNSKIDKVEIKEIKNTSSAVNGIHLRNDSNNNTLTNIAISNISSSSSASSSGIDLRGSSNILTNITISNISSSSSYSSSFGIDLNGSSNTLTNITISNISSSYYSSSYGIHLGGSSNTLTNITISNIFSSASPSFGIRFGSDNNTLSNASISYSKQYGISVENGKTNNTLRNVLVYKNSQAGIQMDGSNTTFSNVYSYANGGAGIAGNGGSNFYYDKLVIFGNAGSNTVGPLKRGFASHWLGGFNDGVLTITGTFGAAWAIAPTNVTGFNINTVGAQTGLTWPATVNWTFGANIPKQMAPVIASDCTLSATSTTKCRPTFGGTTTYNAAKKIGER